ncbi:MAG TPA: hypothetical protein VH592_10045 [Gemmataceae bacterium]|jgi:hypothetical protein
MSRKTITLEVDGSAQEELIRNYHALVMELNDLALAAPDGVVIDQLEDLAIQRGRETLRARLQQAVQKRIDDAEKGAPIRQCCCGQKREDRGKGRRQLTSCLGTLTLLRHWWGNRCPCVTPGGYHLDAALRVDGHLSRRLQRHICRLSAERSFATTRDDLQELLGVCLSAETLRTVSAKHGRQMAAWQAHDTASMETFQAAEGAVEFTVDAGKVHTIEAGWKDLKIAVLQKRPLAESATVE